MLSRSDKSINVSWFYFVFNFKPKDEGIQNANVLSTKSSFVYRSMTFSVCVLQISTLDPEIVES